MESIAQKVRIPMQLNTGITLTSSTQQIRRPSVCNNGCSGCPTFTFGVARSPGLAEVPCFGHCAHAYAPRASTQALFSALIGTSFWEDTMTRVRSHDLFAQTRSLPMV